jgi:hypothetical protein
MASLVECDKQHRHPDSIYILKRETVIIIDNVDIDTFPFIYFGDLHDKIMVSVIK